MPVEKSTIGILSSDYPKYINDLAFDKEAGQMETVFETISALRNVRAEFNVPLGSKIDIVIDKNEELFSKIVPYLERLAKVNSVKFEKNSTAKKSATATVGDTKITIPLEGLIDINQEIERQNKKIDKLQTELKSIEGRLNNPNFVNSAPSEVVDKTKTRQKELTDEINVIKETIKKLS